MALKRNILSVIYILAIAFFAGYYISIHSERLAEFYKNASIVYLIACFGFSLTSYAIFCIAFVAVQKSIESPSRELNIFEWLYVFIFGYIGRYIPGKIFVIIGRMLILEKYNISKTSAAISAIYSDILSILTAFIFGAPFILFTIDINIFKALIIYLSICCIAISGIYFLAREKKPIIAKTLGNIKSVQFIQKSQLKIPASNAVYAMAVYIFGFIFGGCALIFLANTFLFIQINLTSILFFSSAFYLSSAIGIMALIAPAGIGIREGFLVYFLAYLGGYIDVDSAILLAVTFRVISIVSETILFLISYLVVKKFRFLIIQK